MILNAKNIWKKNPTFHSFKHVQTTKTIVFRQENHLARLEGEETTDQCEENHAAAPYIHHGREVPGSVAISAISLGPRWSKKSCGDFKTSSTTNLSLFMISFPESEYGLWVLFETPMTSLSFLHLLLDWYSVLTPNQWDGGHWFPAIISGAA